MSCTLDSNSCIPYAWIPEWRQYGKFPPSNIDMGSRSESLEGGRWKGGSALPCPCQPSNVHQFSCRHYTWGAVPLDVLKNSSTRLQFLYDWPFQPDPLFLPVISPSQCFSIQSRGLNCPGSYGLSMNGSRLLEITQGSFFIKPQPQKHVWNVR